MATNWSEIYNKVNEVIEAIAPTINPSTSFRKIDPFANIDNLPASQVERTFYVQGSGSEVQQLMAPGIISLNKQFDVVVSYDVRMNKHDLEVRIGMDEEQVRNALLAEESRVNNQNVIMYDGNSIDRVSENRVTVTLHFTTNYDSVF